MGEPQPLRSLDVERRRLVDLLARHVARWPADAGTAARIRRLVETRADCFHRSCQRPGHITASAWILSPDGERALLTHHRKLDRWLQLGGHADGEADPLSVALAEAREESGMQDFEVLLGGTPIDLDVHEIPARRDEPAHEHHDIRYLLRARPRQPIEVSDESHDVRWFTRDELEPILAAEGESLARMARRAWGVD